MTNVLVGTLPAHASQSWTLGSITTLSCIGKWLQHKQSLNIRHQQQDRRFKTSPQTEHYRRPHTPRKSPRRSDKTPWVSKALYDLEKPYSTQPKTRDTNTGLLFRLAAASCGKGRHFYLPKDVYPFDPTIQDHIGVEKAERLHERKLHRPNSGQDAFFISKINNQSGSVAFGIADGVGGWADNGVDSANFSHALCSQMALSAFAWQPTSKSSSQRLQPVQLMQRGYDAVLKDRLIRAGSSTACVGCVNSSGRLQMANLGDSGFLLLRTGRAHYYSNPQTHEFNHPYQLSIVPPKMLAQTSVFGGAHYVDTPSRADLSEDTMQDGDVLILATDGVWDNLNSQDMLNIVKKRMFQEGVWVSTETDGIVVTERLAELTHLTKSEPRALQSTLAASIVSAARGASLDPRHDGPFAKEYQKRFPQDGWRGGKIDDICVVVLVAVRAPGEPPKQQQQQNQVPISSEIGTDDDNGSVGGDPMDVDEPVERR